MEAFFKTASGDIALTVEALGVVVIATGSLQAFARVVKDSCHFPFTFGWRRSVWVDFGIWLMLGLQFLLAADIVRSAIAPSWDNIGQLAAIAGIRTFLNFFLEKDITHMAGNDESKKADTAPKTADAE